MAAWTAWLLIAGGVCFAADIGWTARLACWFSLASTLPSYRQFVGLGGDRAIRAAGHDDAGVFIVTAGNPGARLRATSVQLRRFGDWLWVLRFTTARGPLTRLLRPASQEPRALRRFVRRLGAGRAGSGQFGPQRGNS